MPKLVIVTRAGAESMIQAAEGVSAMTAIRDAGFDELMAICGGSCSCATCHVYVDLTFVDRLDPPSGIEVELVSFSDHYRPNSRLSCQIALTASLDGMRLTIAPED